MNISDLAISDIHDGFINKKFSCEELVSECISNVNRYEKRINAFITTSFDTAIQSAREVDNNIAKGCNLRRLEGIPVVLKDMISTRGLQTTAGSRILEGYIPPFDSTVSMRLKDAGAIIIGKTNQDEFAMGASNEQSGYGVCRNPWDLDRVPGGSSGGSAAAVAARMCVLGFGTDTGGSIRQPSSFCNLVGVKPSYGRVSRYGIIALASSLDQVGPLSKNVEDCSTALKVIAGKDPLDATTLSAGVPDYNSYLGESIQGVKIGVPQEYFTEGMNDEVRKAVLEGIDSLKREGAIVKGISLPHTEYALSVYYIIMPSEASSNLARYDGIRFGPRLEGKGLMDVYLNTREAKFGDEPKRRILLGTYTLSSGYYEAYYKKAAQVRTLIKNDFDDAFKEVDIIACPVSPTTAFKIGEKQDPLSMYLADIYTIASNLAGICGISVPCGFDDKGLPIGMQIIAPAFKEEVMFKAAGAYQNVTDWHKKKPPLKE